jgi:probable rRNA maturation factor
VIIAQRKPKNLSTGGLSSFLRRACKAVGLAGDVNVLLTANQHMRRLNRQFRQNNKPTDVLSFPSHQPDDSREGYAGDLAISMEIAKDNAQRLGHSIQEEIKVLMLHGVLHLAGYDHESDDGEMARLEDRLRRKLGLPTALISRNHSKVLNGIARPRKGR